MSSNYERLAKEYGRHRKAHEGAVQELVSGGRLNAESRVLEIGAGTCNYVAAVRDAVGCRCWAVEPWGAGRELALARGLDVEVSAGKAEELPFEAQRFDFAFCVNVIHHVEDRPALFREAFRVLDDGGTLCIATESHDMIRTRFVHATHFPETVELDIARYSSIEELSEMAKTAGFRGWRETRVSAEIVVESAEVFEAKAFSSLHLISEDAFTRGIARLKADLARGPLRATEPVFAMLWATK
jgi:SAM-dependent methyltransferase